MAWCSTTIVGSVSARTTARSSAPQPVVDRGEDRPEQPGREQRLEERRVVLPEPRDPVPVSDTQAPEAVGQATDPDRQLGVGERTRIRRRAPPGPGRSGPAARSTTRPRSSPHPPGSRPQDARPGAGHAAGGRGTPTRGRNGSGRTSSRDGHWPDVTSALSGTTMANVIEADGLTKWYGKRRGIVDVDFDDPGGRGLRLPGPQRRRQDDDHPPAARLPAADRGSRARCSATTPGRDAAAAHAGVAYVSSEPGLPRAADRARAARLHGAPARPAEGRLATGRRAPRARPDRPGPQAVARQSPEGRRRPGVHGRRAAARHGRADERPRPAHAARVPRRSSPRCARPGGPSSCRRTTCPRSSAPATGSGSSARAAWSTSRRSATSRPRTGGRSTSCSPAAAAAGHCSTCPNVRVVSASARDVHLMVQGDVNPLLRRLGDRSTSRDVSIATLEIEDVFLGYYDGSPAPDRRRGGAAMIAAFRLELRRGRMLVAVGRPGLGALRRRSSRCSTRRSSRTPPSSRRCMEIYPKELMAAFGIDGQPGRPGHLPQLVHLPVPVAARRRHRRDPAGDPRRRGRRHAASSTCRSRRACRGCATWRPRSPARSSVWPSLAAMTDRRDRRWSTCSSSPTSRPTGSLLAGVHALAMALAIAGVDHVAGRRLPRPRPGRRPGGRHPHRHVPAERHRPAVAGHGRSGATLRVPLLRPQGADRRPGRTRSAIRRSTWPSRSAAGCSRSWAFRRRDLAA